MPHDAKEVAAKLAPSERLTLLECVRKAKEEDARLERYPEGVRKPYFASGVRRRAAYKLRALGCLSINSCFDGTGAHLYPSPFGRLVAAELENSDA